MQSGHYLFNRMKDYGQGILGSLDRAVPVIRLPRQGSNSHVLCGPDPENRYLQTRLASSLVFLYLVSVTRVSEDNFSRGLLTDWPVISFLLYCSFAVIVPRINTADVIRPGGICSHSIATFWGYPFSPLVSVLPIDLCFLLLFKRIGNLWAV